MKLLFTCSSPKLDLFWWVKLRAFFVPSECPLWVEKTYKGVRENMDNSVKYAIQLAMLKKLKDKGMISLVEYKKIRAFLKEKYGHIDVA